MIATAERIEDHARCAVVERQVLQRVFRRPPRLTIAEWSERYRYLPKESSPGNPGPYSFDLAPYQREPMEVMSDPTVSRVALMFASQTGKSLILENAIGHGIHLRPRPMLMVQPKIDSAESWSKERFAPMVSSTPVLRGLVRDPKRRSSENTLRLKLFPGGFLAIASANSPAELAARAVALVLADEVDRYEESAGTEGDPIDLAERRMASVDHGLLVMTSTPGNKGESRIEPAYEAGDQRRYFVPCPHCGHLQELLLGSPTTAYGLKWDTNKPETAQYMCANCAVLIDEKHKAWMLRASSGARWIPQAPDHPYPSFHLNALYSPFGGTRWAKIAEKFLESQGKPQRLKTFVNTFLAETWEETGERLEAHVLLDRVGATWEKLPEGTPVEVPSGVRVLTAAVDVQDDRLELWVWGWGERLESWSILAEQIPGDPGTPEPWRILDEMRARRFRAASGREFMIAAGFVDSGGHHTSQVYAWCRPRQREHWYACKGSSEGEGVALIGKPTYQTKAKVMLYSVGVFTAKESFLRSQLHVAKPGPGYVHLADWVTLEHLEQFTSEKLVKRIVRNRRHREWVKVRDRNEALDCRNYAFAALHSLSVRWLRKHGILGVESPSAGGPSAREEPDAIAAAPESAPPDRTTTAAPSTEQAEPSRAPTPPEPPDPPDEPQPRRRRRRRTWANSWM